MEMRALFVRLPAAQVAELDEAVARLRTTKQALVGSLLAAQLQSTVGVAEPIAGAPEVLTFDELVDLLRLPPDAVRARVEAGDLPGRRFGDDWRFARHAVLDWLAGSDASRHTGFGTSR
jgi:excisionase family DNA binding protein